MYSKVNYMIVGIFVLLFGVSTILFAFWLAKYGLTEDFDTYRLEMEESVTGLSQESSVKLRGVDIGKVSKIHINPKNIEKVEIFLKIKQGIPIKEDMVASTKMFGITGLLSIEITGGTNESKTLKPTKNYIPLIKTQPSYVAKISDDIVRVIEKLEILLEQSQALLSKDNIETVGNILLKFEKVEGKVISSLDETDVTLKEFRTSMINMNSKLAEATTDFRKMQKDFSDIKKVTIPAIDEWKETGKNFKNVTFKVDKSLDRGDYNFKKIFEPMLIDIEVLSNQINDLATQIGESPNDLIFKSRKPRKGPGE